MLVLEKDTAAGAAGGGGLRGGVDLPGNGVERGLLGIALHPRFATNGFVYLYWTESTTGADTTVLAQTSRCSATASTASSGTAAP